jgi:aminoglycoside 6'-N-acetyltransferase I
VIVRAVTASDRPGWLSTRARLWPESAGAHASEIDRLLAGERRFAVLVAEREPGELVGFVEVGTRDYAEGCESSPVAFIEGWWVESSLRRSGVGARLVAAAEQWGRAHGLTEIASDTELANEISQRAHRALGYQEVERLVCFRESL